MALGLTQQQRFSFSRFCGAVDLEEVISSLKQTKYTLANVRRPAQVLPHQKSDVFVLFQIPVPGETPWISPGTPFQRPSIDPYF